ncbi:hypothetical protein OH77DRAFT_978128 [Trametes cingulata]|nr:hypothetical protein OH77DRAFT_978128 [Trametes cingulata]
MLVKAVLFSLVAGSAVFGAPAPPQVTDTDVLQFALTLEHLESAFYSSALAKYDAKAFADAGFPDFVRGRFVQIAEHEAAHVSLLSGALGAQATKPCEYNFSLNGPASFVALSQVLESVGDSAYLGAAQLISDKSVLTAAASILSVEARHAGWVSSSVQKLQPWNGAFDAPLTPSGAFSLASSFVQSCPSSNPALPVKTFPALAASGPAPAAGASLTLEFVGREAAPAYVAWLDGLNVIYSDLSASGMTTVPSGLRGTVFLAVVSSKETPDDDNMQSAFTVLQFPFDSSTVVNA